MALRWRCVLRPEVLGALTRTLLADAKPWCADLVCIAFDMGLRRASWRRATPPGAAAAACCDRASAKRCRKKASSGWAGGRCAWM